MPIYSVVLYRNDVDKTFSVTARKTEGARLAEVNTNQKYNNFSVNVISSGVTHAVATREKRLTERNQKIAGYHRVTRNKI